MDVTTELDLSEWEKRTDTGNRRILGELNVSEIV